MLKIAHRGASATRPENTVHTVAGKAALLLDVKTTHLGQIVQRIEQQRWELHCILGLRNTADIARVKQTNPNIRVLGFMLRPHSVRFIDEFIGAGADIIRL